MAITICTAGYGTTESIDPTSSPLCSRLHICHAGSAKFVASGKHTVTMTPGRAYFFPPSDKFTIEQDSPCDYEHTFIDFIILAPNVFDEPFEINPDDFPLFKDIIEFIRALIYDMSSLHHNKFYTIHNISDTDPRFRLLTHCLDELISLLITVYKNKKTTDIVISKVLEYINDNYSRKISLDDLARIAYMNKNYFIRRFTKEMSMTPYQYIQLFRANNVISACRSGMSVTEASEKAGFSNPSSFYRCIKKLGIKLK